MTLRTAKFSQSDFEAFVRLHESQGISQVYMWDVTPKPIEDIEDIELKRILYFFEHFDWETLRYTWKDFEFDTSHHDIVFVEDNGKIVGYFQFSKQDGKRYKFMDWRLENEYQAQKEEIWNSFLEFFRKNHKGIKELSVCLALNNLATPWFEAHEFVESGHSFFSLYLQNR
ncbi:MAG: hypothetical protein IJ867_00375 [Clostridia bacterium]|nr:hypothetical protein [Clostridia bacterium]